MANRFWRKKSWRAILLAACLAGCSEPIEHDQDMATKRALEFADTVLVRQDFENGYNQMSRKAKAYIPFNIFKDAMVRLHPDGFPRRVEATDYRALAGYDKVYVTLHGENAGRPFDYVLTLLGTAQKGYGVTIVNRLGFASTMSALE